MKNQLVKWFNRLKNKLQEWAAKAICLSGAHTMPRWKQAGYTAQVAYYYGECRNCTKRLTVEYKYSEGPLLSGIPIASNRIPSRDIKTIIKASINMFINDRPTNQPL